MGFLTTLLRPQAWDGDVGLTDERLARFFAGAPTHSGVTIGPESAMRISTYFACVRALAEDIAKLPLILYRHVGDGGRERATDHPLYRRLHRRPNGFQTSFRFRQSAQAQLGLRGNSYALITRVRGEVRELLPVHPDKVQVRQGRDWRLSYRIDGSERDPQDVLHVRGLSLDGVTGVSVATYARETLGLSAAAEAYGARLFGRGALFRGLLKHPGKLKDAEVAKRVRASFDEAYGGENSGGTALLEEGMTWEKVGMTAEDSQFLGTREFQAYDIARWFRMPPSKVGLLKEQKYASREHESLEYLIDTLLSWLINWEQELNASLLTEDEQEEYFLEHLVDGLLRGDQKARYEAYRTAIVTGFMSRNEARRKENWNPSQGLDEFLVPMNMATAEGAIR